jgi:hypothetical protein
MKHYKLTKNTKTEFGVKLFQIEATIDFKWAKKGELGGWIEKEENLEQDGDARVYGNARVYGDAWVSGDARVYGNAQVYGDAQVYGKLKLLAGYFFGIRYQKEEIKFVDIDEDYELIYRGEAKFGDNEDDEVAKAIKLLEEKGKLKDGKILI